MTSTHMPSTTIDDETLSAFRAGDRETLGRVYRDYVDRLDAYLSYLARSSRGGSWNSSTLSDLRQDVFLRAFSDRARERFDGQRPFRPYLHAIARNRFIDALQAGSREIPTAPEDLPGGQAADADLEAADPVVTAKLRAFLEALSDDLKTICEYRFVRGWPQASTCKALGLTRRQLRTKETRLRRTLEQVMAKRLESTPLRAAS